MRKNISFIAKPVETLTEEDLLHTHYCYNEDTDEYFYGEVCQGFDSGDWYCDDSDGLYILSNKITHVIFREVVS